MGVGREGVEDVLTRVVRWAETRSDIRAVALVGSYARRAERTDSDIDLAILTSSPDRYTRDEDWVIELGLGNLVQTKDWGAIKERRLRLPDGLEIEVGIGEPTWASVDPLDPGTRDVVNNGMRPLYDPDGLLQRLQLACS
jgi:predicted nucleotidyltransferase